jgi:hypothetical protein
MLLLLQGFGALSGTAFNFASPSIVFTTRRRVEFEPERDLVFESRRKVEFEDERDIEFEPKKRIDMQ